MVMRIYRCSYLVCFVFCALYLVLCSLLLSSLVSVVKANFLRTKCKAQRTKYEVHHSIDILSAAAVAHGAKIKESTVTELSK